MKSHYWLRITCFFCLYGAPLNGLAVTAPAPFLIIPQTDSLPESLARKKLITGLHAGIYTGSLLILNNAWYKDFPKSALHAFNDAGEWLQVDKVGHAWSAYGLSRSSNAAWKWTGANERNAAILGSISGFTFLTIIEFLDARSAKWGWSWSDVAANVAGTGLFLGQQLAWGEQRMYLKFSFHRQMYGTPMLSNRANELFGKSWYERMLKDYNGQTYWLSINLRSMQKNKNLPAWLNLAVGYGANGMLGGFNNVVKDAAGNIIFDASQTKRIRQFYLSPDIDFMRIPTRKKWLRPVFFILNGFKFPLPTLLIDERGKGKAYLLYF